MAAFDRDQLLQAFDEIGAAAASADTMLHLAVYGGSALMLASNFRFASEDVDVAELPSPWPDWLSRVVAALASRHGWAADWLNDAVAFHLSKLASLAADHVEFGTFPRRAAQPGLAIYVPTAEYMLALKVKSVRTLDPAKGQVEAEDIRNLMAVVGAESPEAAVAIMARYFPRTAQDPAKQLFLLRHALQTESIADAPVYPRRGG